MTNVTMDLVDAIGEAFNANNIDAVMKFFSQDAVFDHAVGPDVHGVRFEGAEAIRAIFCRAVRQGRNRPVGHAGLCHQWQ